MKEDEMIHMAVTIYVCGEIYIEFAVGKDWRIF